MKNILTLSILLGLMLGCGSKETKNEEVVVDENLTEQDQQQQIYDEVMGLHDELMPKMDELYKMRTAIIQKADSLEGAGQPSDKLRQTIADLEAGEEAMMDWMRNFKSLPENTPHDSVINYMTSQREKIMLVKEQMEKAMQAGREANN